MVIATGGPPCPDFSSIRQQPKGSQGSTGPSTRPTSWPPSRRLFTQYQYTCFWRTLSPTQTYKQTSLTFPISCASSPSLSTRPMVESYIADACGGHQWVGNMCKKFSRATLLGRASGWTANKAGPGLTTPAPDENGRPPPTRTNEKPNTMARWQADRRRFAPWQYQAKYLVTSQQGTTSLAPAAMREQMMGFSGTHTANMTHDPTEHHRNKALGNTWHAPTATWLLFIILLNTLAVPATSVTYTPTQRASVIWLASPVHFGPSPRPAPYLHMPQFSWQDYLQWARTLDTSHTPKALDPTLVWCVHSSSLSPHGRFPQTSSRRDPTVGRRHGRCHTPQLVGPPRSPCSYTFSSRYSTHKQTSWSRSLRRDLDLWANFSREQIGISAPIRRPKFTTADCRPQPAVCPSQTCIPTSR